jgi:acetate kinase
MVREQSVLVVNAGSSSLKVKLLPQGLLLLVERIGTPQARLQGNVEESQASRTLNSLSEALAAALDDLSAHLEALAAVGHRVVHGGERYTEPTLIDAEVIEGLEALSPLAPLHNPANLAGIRAAMRLLPKTPQVAVFDTAFHATLPSWAYLYGLPRRLYGEGIRRYGFHGTSHDFVTREAARILGRPREALRLVSLHLGNGASASAVAFGKSIDTSMGLTPLEGLMMGSRPGDLDPGVVLHLLRGGMAAEEVDRLLNKESGLLGLSGLSNDMRDLRQAAPRGHEAARQALDVYAYRIRKCIGAYAAAMGGLDAVVFTGGVGENDAETRREALTGLEFLGLGLDEARNKSHERVISSDHSRVSILVVPTDEEGLIAELALAAAGEEA